LTQFDQSSPVLVILDLMLPDLTGEEVCQSIRKKSRVPVIMLTAKAAEEDLVKVLNPGADDSTMTFKEMTESSTVILKTHDRKLKAIHETLSTY